jgi:glycerate 2-kinase
VKILVAMDSFKGSLSSIEANKAITLGLKDSNAQVEVISVPLADGGEGTVKALVSTTNGQFIVKEVTGPLQEKVTATYGILGDGKTAVIEIAEACGLELVPLHKRNPGITTSYGVGELILDAIHRGCRDFIIGLGGSATNDAGVGMLQALGIHFLTKDGKEIGFGGKELENIEKIDDSTLHPFIKDCSFRIACDVTNPLYGENGATYIYGPQKGAEEHLLNELEENLKHFAHKISEQKGIDVQRIPGSGAAGGLGSAFFAFLNGKLQSGIDLILKAAQVEQKLLYGVDLVITGEGRLDGQTSMGKAPLGIAKLARKYNIPVIALAGSITKDALNLHESGITAFFSIMNEPMTLKVAMDPAITFHNIRLTASQLIRLIDTFYLE